MPMNNVEYAVKANKLIITCDIAAATISKAKASKTGKTNLVASTGGSVKIDGKDGLSFSINVMSKNGD